MGQAIRINSACQGSSDWNSAIDPGSQTAIKRDPHRGAPRRARILGAKKTAPMSDLRQQFQDTLAALRLSDSREAAWEELAARYSEPHRHYHTLAHIGNCLALLAETAHDSPTLRLALYYHDIVYDLCGDQNELQSARFATDQLGTLGLGDSHTSIIYDLIRATDHKSARVAEHSDLICDIDLAILGAPTSGYHDYAAAIRREYSWIPDGKFRSGRTRILESFLNRPAIFDTLDFHSRFEAQARKNIATEISALVSGRTFGNSGNFADNS